MEIEDGHFEYALCSVIETSLSFEYLEPFFRKRGGGI